MKSLHLLLTGLLTCGALTSLSAQEAAPVAPIAAVIEATDSAAIEAALGKVAVVHGTVERIEVSKSEYRKVYFKNSAFFLYISAKDFKAQPETAWGLDAWVGKEIFASGLIKTFYSKNELVISVPGQIGAKAEDLKMPAASTGPGAGAGAPNATGDLEVKLPAAMLTQLRLHISGTKTTRIAKLMAENIEIHWETGARSSTGKALRFDGNTYTARGREPADQAVELVSSLHGGNWPAGKSVRVTRPQSVEGAGWPTTLAMAVLLESSINGWKLPPGLKVLGEISATGAIEGGQSELYHFLQQEQVAADVLIVPTAAVAGLEDLYLQGALPRLAEIRCFGVQTLEDLGTVLEGLEHKTWDAQLTALTQFQKTLATKGVAVLRTPEVRTALAEVQRFCPLLLNAKVLVAAVEGKPPAASYSLTGSAHRLFALHADYLANRELLQKDTPEARKKAKEYKDALLLLKPRAHPKFKLVGDSLDELFDAAQEALRFEAKDASARAKKSRSRLETAASKAAGEVAVLEGEVGLARSAK